MDTCLRIGNRLLPAFALLVEVAAPRRRKATYRSAPLILVTLE